MLSVCLFVLFILFSFLDIIGILLGAGAGGLADWLSRRCEKNGTKTASVN